MTDRSGRVQSTSVELIQRLQATISFQLQKFYSDQPYALLDFPEHANVGDSAIWAGQMAYLRRYWGRDPSYVCSYHNVNWAAMEAAAPNGPILLCGGGAFGDTWPIHQHFREEVLNRNPGRVVIQLPQSLQFNDRSNLRRAAQVIARHKFFVLLARDQASYDLAIKNFQCEVHLCPDMAFCLGQLVRLIRPHRSAVFLLRGDKEAASTSWWDGLKIPNDSVVADWRSEPAYTRIHARLMMYFDLLVSLASLNLRQHSPMARRIRYFDRLANLRLRRGVALISQGRLLVSDRLHAHIIGTLLDVPQLMLDNNYGKISRFIDTWQSDWKGVRRISNLSEAVEQVRASNAPAG
jgi:exopolysaccharide biosynthesis predicted pyruvyltransferase EpsI